MEPKMASNQPKCSDHIEKWPSRIPASQNSTVITHQAAVNSKQAHSLLNPNHCRISVGELRFRRHATWLIDDKHLEDVISKEIALKAWQVTLKCSITQWGGSCQTKYIKRAGVISCSEESAKFMIIFDQTQTNDTTL